MNALKQEIKKLREINKQQHEEIKFLRKENEQYKTQIVLLWSEIKRLKKELEPDPSTPSGSIPPYKKPNKRKGKKSKRPGRKKGHPGAFRKPPEEHNQFKYHELFCCPDCGTPLSNPTSYRERFVEDFPEIQSEITKHFIFRYKCPKCKKNVEPKVDDALPRSPIGIKFLILTAWMHYFQGATIRKIIKFLSVIGNMNISAGGLTQMWQRLAQYLKPLYDSLQNDARNSAVLYVDETGWRINGETHWLWCFTNKNLVYYAIRKSRGSIVLKEILGYFFAGVLISDFFGAYNKIAAWGKQKCIVHLFRELKKVSLKNDSDEWKAFQKKLKRLFRDALRLSNNHKNINSVKFERLFNKLKSRLLDLTNYHQAIDNDTKRLKKRLYRHRDELLIFVNEPDVMADNNHAERILRTPVISRKNSFGNRSYTGAETYAILLSVFQTLDLRKEDAVKWVIDYIKNKLKHSNDCQTTYSEAC